MPLLTELEIIFAVILQICHAYGVRTLRLRTMPQATHNPVGVAYRFLFNKK